MASTILESDARQRRKVAPDWEAAYYTDFSGSSGKGSRLLVVSYASSPPAEVFFAKTPPKDAPTGSIATLTLAFDKLSLSESPTARRTANSRKNGLTLC